MRDGGFVAKYMGDGVLVYFGYPQAHEDDAERAVRAGLALVAAVRSLERCRRSAAGADRYRYRLGGGRRPHRCGWAAASRRSWANAEPCRPSAGRRRSGHSGNCREYAKTSRRSVRTGDIGAKDLKGITEPVRAWAALRASSAEGRFEALHATGLTALVGREEELELMLRAGRRQSQAKVRLCFFRAKLALANRG